MTTRHPSYFRNIDELVAWDPDTFKPMVRATLDTCIGMLEVERTDTYDTLCRDILELTYFVPDPKHARRLDAILLGLERTPEPELEPRHCDDWKHAASILLIHWDEHTQAFLARPRDTTFHEWCDTWAAPRMGGRVRRPSNYRFEPKDAFARAIYEVLLTPVPHSRRPEGLVRWARRYPHIETRTWAHRTGFSSEQDE